MEERVNKYGRLVWCEALKNSRLIKFLERVQRTFSAFIILDLPPLDVVSKYKAKNSELVLNCLVYGTESNKSVERCQGTH